MIRKKRAMVMAKERESRLIQQTDFFSSSSFPAPKFLLTESAKPLLRPNAKFTIRPYSADVAPISAIAVSPSIWPAMEVSARL